MSSDSSFTFYALCRLLQRRWQLAAVMAAASGAVNSVVILLASHSSHAYDPRLLVPNFEPENISLLRTTGKSRIIPMKILLLLVLIVLHSTREVHTSSCKADKARCAEQVYSCSNPAHPPRHKSWISRAIAGKGRRIAH